jgi:hypothetical protein
MMASTGGTWAQARPNGATSPTAAGDNSPSPRRTQVTQSYSGISAGGSARALERSRMRALADDETRTKIRGSDPGASGSWPVGLGSLLMRCNKSNLSPHARATTGGIGRSEGGALTPTRSVAGGDSARLSAPGVQCAFEHGMLIGRARLSLPTTSALRD